MAPGVWIASVRDHRAEDQMSKKLSRLLISAVSYKWISCYTGTIKILTAKTAEAIIKGFVSHAVLINKREGIFMKRVLSLCLAAVLAAGLLTAMPVLAKQEQAAGMDIILFGNETSERAHQLEERLSVRGVDDVREAEYIGDDGKLTGGGLGDGLTYRYIKPPADEAAEKGKLEFTLQADPTRQNYITVRLSGSQQGRGNLMLYGPDGDTSVLDPFAGRPYSELDNGYFTGAPFEGRYYYSTYAIPQGLVSGDGTVRVSIIPTGRIDAYGKSIYNAQSENSKYIYSAASHTDPFYVPEDGLTGEAPKGTAAKRTDQTPYEYLRGEVVDMTRQVMSWQLYGPEYEKFKSEDNAFLDGAVLLYQPIREIAGFQGTKDEWSRKFSLGAVNHQNWSPMSVLQIYANAYMFDITDGTYHAPELLDRYFRLLDFFARAQEANGGWCYYTAGEDAGKWLGVSYDGTGERLKGERWPLLSLGVDAMMQSFIQLYGSVMEDGGQEQKAEFQKYLDQAIDGDLTGRMDKTRREYYIEMFGKLREYLANPQKGEFFAPSTRAGTANQDFGFAYDANRVVRLLSDGVDGKLNVDAEYLPKADAPYLEQMTYKFGEMVDGQKWFSSNGLGLEGGASHGGWAGDYGTLLIGITNKYAESASHEEGAVRQLFDTVAKNAFETAKYFYYPGVNANGETILQSETFASSRNCGYGQKVVYPVAGYTAARLDSPGALRFLTKYVGDNRAYFEPLRSELESRTPHVYTRIVETQEILKYYKEAETLLKEGGDEPLPMEEEHEDFAWADPDGQVIVFKNHGDQAYITFHYRREDWTYNDNTRIHFTEDGKTDRLANVKGSHQGGIFTYEDRTPGGETVTHTRYDGYSEVRYGSYIAGINQSKEDPAVGQTGKTYLANTTGVKRARDLISGREYTGKDGGDIEVMVSPQQAIVLEILETAPVYEVSAKFVEGNTILGYTNVTAELGKTVRIDAETFDGYKLTDEGTKQVTVSDDRTANTLTFQYETNRPPAFEEPIRQAEPDVWRRTDYHGVTGAFVTDSGGGLASVTSKGFEGDNILGKTFVYREATGDVTLDARLDHFERTATDQEYASLILSDSLDLEKANYVELRHFSNNNNILLVSHSAGQKDKVTGYWAGDMNNKSVPIRLRLSRTGGTVEYWFSLDDGKTYEQTTKPRINFHMGNCLYAGVAMTSAFGEENTVFCSDVAVEGNLVGAPVSVGEELRLDFSASDPEGDPLSWRLDAPEGWTDDGNHHINWTPAEAGEYVFHAAVTDPYHERPVTKTIKVVAGDVPRISCDGEILAFDVSPILQEDRVLVPVRIVAEKLGWEVGWDEDTQRVTVAGESRGIILQIGSQTAIMDGKELPLDVPAQKVRDMRTMVPVRFVAEALGADVDWLPEDNLVVIRTGKLAAE